MSTSARTGGSDAPGTTTRTRRSPGPTAKTQSTSAAPDTVDLDGSPWPIETQSERAPVEAWTWLGVAAANFDDAQRFRIRLNNRVTKYPTIDRPEISLLLELAEGIEASARKELRAEYRRTVPSAIIQWQKDTKGIGDHTLALLLAATKDPGIARPRDTEGNPTGPSYHRSVSTLWSYCGHGAPLKRRKGMSEEDARAMGNPAAKRATFLLAEAVIKSGNERYREVYDWRREVTAGTHPDWTKGHSHADALRIVGKWILFDLWCAATGN